MNKIKYYLISAFGTNTFISIYKVIFGSIYLEAV